MDIDIVKILGVGLSGFGFLLMYLAYKLIDKIINNNNVLPGVFPMISTFMVLCFIMTVTVGVFTYITTGYKNSLIADQSQTIGKSTEALNVLVAAQKNNALADSLIHPATMTASVKQKQKTALDTIAKYVAKSNDKATMDTFEKSRSIITDYPNALKKIDPADTKKVQELNMAYKQANSKISAVSLRISEAKFKPIKKM